MIRSPEDITPVLKRALDYRHDPVLIGGHVDYRDNHKLFETVQENKLPLGVFERAGALDHAVVIGERPR